LKVNIRVHQAQHDFLTSQALNTGLVAGLGSGKSHIATLKTILIKLAHPEMRVAYYLPTVPLIKDIAFLKFPEMLTDMGLEFVLNKSDKEIHIEGYGTIIFRSMSNPETIVGYEVYYSLIDEVDILPQDIMETAFNKILARNRQKGPEANRLDVVGTPEGFKFFHDRFVNKAQPTDKLIVATTYANKHLPEGYIALLEAQYPPNLLEAYLKGKFVNLTSGTVYSYFDRTKHNCSLEIGPHDAIYVGQDFNVGGCVSKLFIIRDDIPYLVEEMVSHDTMEVCANLKDKYPNHRIFVYPDASGDSGSTNATKSDIQLLRDAGFTVTVNASNPRVQDRVNSVNALFAHNRLFVNVAKCPRSAEALERQAYDDQGRPEKFSGAATVDDHNDALGYFIVKRFGISKTSVEVKPRRYT